VLLVASSLLPLAGLFQVFDGIQVVTGGILRGLGDTRSPMIINLLGFWGVGIPAGLLLGFKAGMGAQGLWWGLVVGLASVAVILLVRVRYRIRARLGRVLIDDHVHAS
jgi:MATE family multidrug resistance protein